MMFYYWNLGCFQKIISLLDKLGRQVSVHVTKLSKKMPWNEKVKLCNVSPAVRDTVRFRKAVSTFMFFWKYSEDTSCQKKAPN